MENAHKNPQRKCQEQNMTNIFPINIAFKINKKATKMA